MARTPRDRLLRPCKVAAIKRTTAWATLEDRYDDDGVPRNMELGDSDNDVESDSDDEGNIESDNGGGEGNCRNANDTHDTVCTSRGFQADNPSENGDDAAASAVTIDTADGTASGVGLETPSSDNNFESGTSTSQALDTTEESEPLAPTISKLLGSELVTFDDHTLGDKLKEAVYEELELQAEADGIIHRLETKRAEIRGMKMVLNDRLQRQQSVNRDHIDSGVDLNHSQHDADGDGEEEGVTWKDPDAGVDFIFELDEETQGDHQATASEVPARIENITTSSVSNETLPNSYPTEGRHLCINPCNPSAIATSGLAGGLEIWGYSHTPRTLSRIALLDPTSFRSKMQTVAAIAWSPEGTNIAMGFEYPHDGKAEFCVVQLAGFKPLEDAKTPQVVPKDRVSLVTSRTHRHGLSSIAWVPSLAGQATRQLATTGRAEKDAVVLWSEREWSEESQSCWHEHALHSEQHQDSVQAMCIHSGQSAVFTGGRDGHVIRCSLQSGQTSTVMTAGSDDDALNVNAVLEHPTDPNILMISSVEVSQNRVVLHDLRQQYNGIRSAASVLVATSDVFATRRLHMQPRWSPTGVHVSCGGTGGVVSIWDIRSVASARAQPHQYLRLHCGTLAAFS
jgi:hypothetical protein